MITTDLNISDVIFGSLTIVRLFGRSYYTFMVKHKSEYKGRKGDYSPF